MYGNSFHLSIVSPPALQAWPTKREGSHPSPTPTLPALASFRDTEKSWTWRGEGGRGGTEK